MLSKQTPRFRVVEKPADVHPIRPVEVVDHGKDFQAGVFHVQVWHDPLIDGANGVALNHVKELVGLVVHGLQVAVGSEHVQPIGIEKIDLMSEIAQRGEAGSVPGHIESGANAFLLIQRYLRGSEF